MYIPKLFSQKWTSILLQNFRDIFENDNVISSDLFKNDFTIKDGIADLSGISFVGNYKKPKIVKNINFYRSYFKDCNFKDITFENVNFSQCFIEDCYLRRTKFINCTFIGTRFISTDMIDSEFNSSLLRHIKIHNCYISTHSFDNIKTNRDNQKHKLIHYSKKEIYAQLKANCYSYGDYNKANYFKEKELKENIKDFRTRKKYFNWISSLLIVKISGYGYKPLNIFIFSSFIILIYSFIYLFIGFQSNIGETYKLSSIINSDNLQISKIIFYYIRSLYFSVVTFTTLGFGDYFPLHNSLSFLIVPTEALIGAFSMAIFVVVLANRFYKG